MTRRLTLVMVAACGHAPSVSADLTTDGPLDTVDAAPTDPPVIPPCRTEFAPSEIISGSVVIANPLDIQVLQDKHVITGALTIMIDADDVSLPNLEAIEGGLLVGSGPTTTVELDRLCHVGDSVTLGLGAMLSDIRIPALREIGGGIDVFAPNLTGLAMPSLVTIGAELWIASPLATLDAPALVQIGGGLALDGGISGTIPLTTLSGLRFVASVPNIVINNTSLQDLSGLDRVRTLPGGLYLLADRQLTSLDGLQLDPAPIGGLGLQSLPVLHDISALSTVTAITDGRLQVEGCAQLADLSGLSGITSVGGNISVTSNPLLAHVDLGVATAGTISVGFDDALVDIAMPNLTSLTTSSLDGAVFEIMSNANLANISFPALTSIGGNAGIVSNPVLPTCQATALEMQIMLPVQASFTIVNNGTGACM